jgi:hypothetical protein
MAEIIDRDDAVEYTKGEPKLLLHANQSEEAITQALSASNGEVLAALNRSGRYDDAAVSALTSATAPGDLKSLTLARFLHHLTKADDRRPDRIGSAAADASKTLSFIATGNYVVEGITASTVNGVTYQVPTRKFDRANNDYYGIPTRS